MKGERETGEELRDWQISASLAKTLRKFVVLLLGFPRIVNFFARPNDNEYDQARTDNYDHRVGISNVPPPPL